MSEREFFGYQYFSLVIIQNFLIKAFVDNLLRHSERLIISLIDSIIKLIMQAFKQWKHKVTIRHKMI